MALACEIGQDFENFSRITLTDRLNTVALSLFATTCFTIPNRRIHILVSFP